MCKVHVTACSNQGQSQTKSIFMVISVSLYVSFSIEKWNYSAEIFAILWQLWKKVVLLSVASSGI